MPFPSIRSTGLLFLLGISAVQAEESGVILGTAVAPIGQSAKGTIASACPAGTLNNCVDVPITIEGRVVPFRIPGLDPKASYSIILWKDANKDGTVNKGDLVGSFMRYAPQSDRLRLFSPTPNHDPAVLPLVYFHQFSNIDDTFNEPFEGKGTPISSLNQLVGTWQAEKSGPGEMALAASTSLVREGAGLRGSSMLVGVSKPRARYIRNGALLTVKPDGSFIWVSADDEFDNNNCSTIGSMEQKGTPKVNGNVVKVTYGPSTGHLQRQCETNGPNTNFIAAGEIEQPVSFQLGADKRMRMKFGEGDEASIFVRQ